MVRGHADCPELCKHCRHDCICSVCSFCHGCHLRDAHYRHDRNLSHYSAAEHDCNLNTSVAKNEISGFQANFESDVYQIKVGSEVDGKVFYVHKSSLINNSAYFAGLLNFKSDSEKHCVTLDTAVDLPEAFALFIQYAYLKDYYVEDKLGDALPHAQVYVLAERLEALDLKKLALKKAITICWNISETAAKSHDAKALKGLENIGALVRTIYDNTPGTQKIMEPPEIPVVPMVQTRESRRKAGRRGSFEDISFPQLSSSVQNPPYIRKQSKDEFRVLIARFCASCLNSIKNQDGFSDCLSDILEFAQDLMKYVVQSGPLQLDSSGQLKD